MRKEEYIKCTPNGMQLTKDNKRYNAITNRLENFTNMYCPCVKDSIGKEEYKCPCVKSRTKMECCCGLYERKDINIKDISGNEYIRLRKDKGYSITQCNNIYQIMEMWSSGAVTVKMENGCMTKHISEFEIINKDDILESNWIHEYDGEVEDNRC